MNKVILMGRLTRDPEVRNSQGENSSLVAHYTIAVDRRSRGKTEGQQTADFIACTAFGKSAEFAERNFHQGTKVALTGRIQTGSYTNKDGQKVYTTDVIVEEQEFAESRAAADARMAAQQGGGYGQAPAPQAGYGQYGQAPAPQAGYGQAAAPQRQAAAPQQGYGQAPIPQRQAAAPQAGYGQAPAPQRQAAAPQQAPQGGYQPAQRQAPAPQQAPQGGYQPAQRQAPAPQQAPRQGQPSGYAQPGFADGFATVPEGMDDELPFN